MNSQQNQASEDANARGNLDRQGPDHQAAPPGEISTLGLRNWPPAYETAIRSMSACGLTNASVGCWNVRGLMEASDRTKLNQLKMEQIFYHSFQHTIGVLCLSEVHCRSQRLEGKILDPFKEFWSYHLGGDISGGSQGTVFLVSPKFKVQEFTPISPRLSQINLLPIDQPAEVILLSCYAPTESGGTISELFEFYSQLDAAIGDCVRGGIQPVIAGDFNVKLGEDLGDDEEEICTGPLVMGMHSSPNCSYLFGICRKYDYVIANSFYGSNVGQTWYHPNTGQGHVKDLILIPRAAISIFKDLVVDQGAVVGNNDHNLVVIRPVTSLRHRRKLLLNIYGKHSLYPEPPPKSTAPLSPNSKFRSKMRRKDLDSLMTSARGPYNDELVSLLEQAPDGWEGTVTSMQSALLKTLPEKGYNPVPQSWQEIGGQALRQCMKACAKARRYVSLDPTSTTRKDCLKSKKNELHRLVNRCKVQFDNLHIGRFQTKGRHEKAASARLLRGEPPRAPPPEVSPSDFAKHFENLFSRESDDDLLHLSRYAHLLPPKSRPRTELGGVPLVTEVAEAIDRLNLKKASGADGLTAESFKAAKDVLSHRLAADFSQFWPQGPEVDFNTRCEVFSGWQNAEVVTIFKGKGLKTDPGAFRGVFLLEVAGKALTSLVAERIGGLIDSYLSDSQCGFRKRRGTVHQIHVLRRLQSEVRKASLKTAAIFVDFEKAFDSPPRGAIYECLEYIGCPPDILAVIRAIHLDPKACVKGTDAWFRVARGIRQGCVLGPILFNLVLHFCTVLADFQHDGIDLICVDKHKDLQCPRDILGHTFNFKDAAYADDLALVGSSLPGLEDSLQRLQNITGPIGLNVSVKKTEWMWLFAPPQDLCAAALVPNTPCCSAISLNGRALVHVRQFTYLGAVFSEDGALQHELDTRISKSKSKLFSLSFLWKSKTELGHKIRLFKQLVLPVLLYGCETWTLRHDDWAKLEVFFNLARLALANRPRYLDGIVLPNEELHEMVRLPTVATLVVPRQLNFTLGHIFNPSSLTARHMSFARVKHPTSILSGREKVNYTKCVLANLGFLADVLSNTNREHHSKMIVQFTNAVVESAGPSGQHNLGLDGVGDGGEANPPLLELHDLFLTLGQMQGNRRSATIIRSICGIAGPRHGSPNLQRLAATDRDYHCSLCKMAYSEVKALNRHMSKAHVSQAHMGGSKPPERQTSNKSIRRRTADPELPVRFVRRRTWLGIRAETSNFPESTFDISNNRPDNSCIVASMSPVPSFDMSLASQGEERVIKGVRGGEAKKPYPCPHCSLSYKTPGWLTRHVNMAHGQVIDKSSVMEAAVRPDTSPPLKSSNKVKVFNGLSCSLCGAHGKGPGWGEKTLINHWSSAHQTNYKTGLPSRKRKTKEKLP